MKDEEIIKIIKKIVVVLDETGNNELVESLLNIIGEYNNLKEELKEFVNKEIESSSDEDMEDVKIDDEDLVIKVDAKGFHSIK